MSFHQNSICGIKIVIWIIHFIFILSISSFFIYLNRIQPHYFIDEVFHIPQTLQYCTGNYHEWNSKITTLPGLYILTSSILAPLNLCNTLCIRYMNVIFTFVNLILTYEILTLNKTSQSLYNNNWMEVITSYNIILFPPLFFWFFLFYTDIASVTIVLLMLLLHRKHNIKLAAFCGFLSLIVRQTNIIWVFFLTIELIIDSLECKIKKKELVRAQKDEKHLILLWSVVRKNLQIGSLAVAKLIFEILKTIYPYALVGLISIIFLIWNKGIVVGDRTAHVSTIHIPQIFYFSLFTSCFSWPYILPYWPKFMHSIQKHWFITTIIFILFFIIIHYNTMVHPYVLADNRHYVFYVWNRFMGRYMIFKYLLIPFYGFTIYSIICNIEHLRFTTKINYTCCVFLVLIPQLLLEPRYFIIPYLFYRLNLKKIENWQISLELLTMIFINFLQFFIFINKTFYWQDEPNPQRIAW